MLYHFKSLVLVSKGRGVLHDFVPRGVFWQSMGGRVLPCVWRRLTVKHCYSYFFAAFRLADFIFLACIRCNLHLMHAKKIKSASLNAAKKQEQQSPNRSPRLSNLYYPRVGMNNLVISTHNQKTLQEMCRSQYQKKNQND